MLGTKRAMDRRSSATAGKVLGTVLGLSALLALAGAGVPQPAVAGGVTLKPGVVIRPELLASPNTPLWVKLTKLHCIHESSEFNADEPYVVMVAADISGIIPKVVVTRTSAFDDVDTGESRNAVKQFWGVTGVAQAIPDRDKVILLAALVEHDESSPDGVKSLVQSELFANLTAYMQAKLPRDQMVSKLIHDMAGAIDLGVASGGINMDERIGSPREIRLTASELFKARTGQVVDYQLYFADGGDAKYRLYFQMGR